MVDTTPFARNLPTGHVPEEAIDSPPDLPPTDSQGLEKQPVLMRMGISVCVIWILNYAVRQGLYPESLIEYRWMVEAFVTPAIVVMLGALWAMFTAWAPASVQKYAHDAWVAGMNGLSAPNIRKTK